MNLLAKCDGAGGCGQQFTITKFENKKVFDDVKKNFFRCPHCGKEYVNFYTNTSIRKKQVKMRTMKNPTPEKVETLRLQIKAEMDELKVRYGG